MGFPALLIGGAILGGIIYAATRDSDSSSSSSSYDDSAERRQRERNECNEKIKSAQNSIDNAYSLYQSYCNAAFSALQNSELFTLGQMDLSKDQFLQICNKEYGEVAELPAPDDLSQINDQSISAFSQYANLSYHSLSPTGQKLQNLRQDCIADLQKIDNILAQLPNSKQ